jgi:hypothetical protein
VPVTRLHAPGRPTRARAAKACDAPIGVSGAALGVLGASLPGVAAGIRRLARPLELERVYAPDREAMVAALRVVLDLPRQLPDRGRRGDR